MTAWLVMYVLKLMILRKRSINKNFHKLFASHNKTVACGQRWQDGSVLEDLNQDPMMAVKISEKRQFVGRYLFLWFIHCLA